MKTVFLGILFFCGHLWAQSSIQETVSVGRSNWSVSAFSLLIAEGDQIDRGGSIFTYNYIGPNYRLNYNERLAVKIPFLMNSSGYDRFNGQCVQEQDMSLSDPFINYSNYNLGVLLGNISTYWDGRVYLPLSKTSRRQKMIGRVRSNFIISHLVTQSLEVEWRNEFNYYHQSKSTYFAEGTNDQCQVVTFDGPSNTRRFRMDNWFNFWYRLNRRWSLGMSVVFREDIRNDSKTVITSRERNGRLKEIWVRTGPTIRWMATHNLSFIGTFSDKLEYSGFHPDRQDDLSDLGKFKSENFEFTLNSFIRF